MSDNVLLDMAKSVVRTTDMIEKRLEMMKEHPELCDMFLLGNISDPTEDEDQ